MKIFTAFLFLMGIINANSQLLMHEPFSYLPSNTNGLNVQSNSVWKNANSGDSILVVSGSLSYPGLAASQGEKVTFDGAGIDNYRAFTTQTSGEVYTSCLFNVASLGLMNTTGTYVTSLTEANSTSAFGASIWLRKSTNTGKYNIGISNRSNSTVSYLTNDLDSLTSYFLVFSYQIIGGTGNDVSTLWLNTAQFGGMEPTASIAAIGGTDLSASGIGRIMLRQPASTAPAPFIQFDEIRVGTTWESVTPCASPGTYYADSDGDTFGDSNSSIQSCVPASGYVTNNTDCNDANTAVNPNTIWYADADGDLFGNALISQTSCTQPTGYVQNSTDCDDANTNVNASGTFYQDLDQDGFGNVNVPITNCGQPSGYVSNSTDCDDNNAFANVVLTWYQDNDGDGYGSSVSTQNCGQPNGYVSQLGDCDDNSNSVNPNAIEIFDGIDNDCDGAIDEGFTVSTWYLDNDQDGFGGSSSVQAIQSPGSNYTNQGGDCDDALASINPNAQEVCDGIDNNCDGQMDNGLTFFTYYADLDGDNYGNPNTSVSACSQPSGYVLNNSDCNDAAASINPNAVEICDGIDNNCNGTTDENLLLLTYYADMDGDNYGNDTDSLIACSQPVGYVVTNTDCDDTNSGINPGATDIPVNGIDEDCTGSDAQITSAMLGMFEFTQLAGCPVTATSVTSQPTSATFSTYSNMGGTCVPTANVFNNNNWNSNSTINSTNYNEFSIQANSCFDLTLTKLTFTHKVSNVNTIPVWHLRSNIDNYASDIASDTILTNLVSNDTVNLGSQFQNINQVSFRFYITGISNSNATWRNDNVSLWGIPLSISPQTFYADIDNDGFGDLANDTLTCTMPAGFVTDSSDCNDANAQVNPLTTWYFDNDGDLIGDSSNTFTGCIAPTGYVLAAGDCDDLNDTITGPVMYYSDLDGDTYGDFSTAQALCQNPGAGFVTNGLDCNDQNNAIHPGAVEICDGVDNDCVGGIDDGLTFVTYYTDQDGDGVGTGNGQSLCQNPGAGFVTLGGDCNDNDEQIYPGAIEICDGIDNNCIGGIDEGLIFNTYFVDADNDNFGTGTGQSLCSDPGAGYTTIAGDCNDTNNQIYPGATEILDNSIDENCDGVDGYLGINDNNLLSVELLPNPTTGLFEIRFSEANEGAITITDLNGKIIKQLDFYGSTFMVDVNDCINGTYFIVLKTESSTQTIRFVKI